MLRARRKKFFLLIILFAALSPILIIYSLGYTFDFAKGSWEKTGGIFLKSKIPRLSLFLNGKFEKETSFLSGGVLLTKIKPGNYLIRLEKKSQQPWAKNRICGKGHGNRTAKHPARPYKNNYGHFHGRRNRIFAKKNRFKKTKFPANSFFRD